MMQFFSEPVLNNKTELLMSSLHAYWCSPLNNDNYNYILDNNAPYR